jgi:hypothetical protein
MSLSPLRCCSEATTFAQSCHLEEVLPYNWPCQDRNDAAILPATCTSDPILHPTIIRAPTIPVAGGCLVKKWTASTVLPRSVSDKTTFHLLVIAWCMNCSTDIFASGSFCLNRCILTLFLATISDSSHHWTIHYGQKESFDTTHYCQCFSRLSLSSSILGAARTHGYPLGYDCINVARYNPTQEMSISSVQPSMEWPRFFSIIVIWTWQE